MLQVNDPITRGPGLFDPTTKLAICEFVILFSFLAFAQSIRMMNHLVSTPLALPHACSCVLQNHSMLAMLPQHPTSPSAEGGEVPL